MNRDAPGAAVRPIELLAPAGNREIGIAAIDHGADAVYIGGPLFGARAAAANSVSEIGRLADYAHRFRARVYVALNTLLEEAELQAAVALSWQLYEAGADALIIQDMGLLECELPPIALHASTQCDNRSVRKVRFLEQVGFSQVVLARELNLAQIGSICRQTGAVIECFVHGALCVSYSGQCYISEYRTGRSANRGACAQFCRHRYRLTDNTGASVHPGGYLLSLSDLNCAACCAELIDAGVGSLKIEGRLKDGASVKNVTAAYRQILDELIAEDSSLRRASSGHCRFAFTPDPARTFSRGATEFFLKDPKSRPGSVLTPKAIGQRIGTVVEVGARHCRVDTGETLANGDGLCFIDQRGELCGLKVNRVEGGRVFTRSAMPARLGDELYRNHDADFLRQLESSSGCRRIDLALEVTVDSGTIAFLLLDEDGITSEFSQQAEREKARQPESTAAMIARQAVKSGDSVFRVTSCQVHYRQQEHYSAADINKLRRLALEHHEAERRRQCSRVKPADRDTTAAWISRQATWRDNITNSRAEAFYRRHGVTEFTGLGAARRRDMAQALMTTRYCLRLQLGLCPAGACGNGSRIQAQPLYLTDNTGTYELSFDCSRCEMTLRPAEPASVPEDLNH